MTMERVMVINGVRTPFVRARTVFQKMPPSALGGITLRETIARSDLDPTLIEEIYYGIVSHARPFLTPGFPQLSLAQQSTATAPLHVRQLRGLQQRFSLGRLKLGLLEE